MPAALPLTVPQMQNSPTVLHNRAVKSGAGTKSRTRDPLITSQVLYQLSYTGLLKCFATPSAEMVPAPRVELGTP